MENDAAMRAMMALAAKQAEALDKVNTAMQALLPVLGDITRRLDQLEKHDN